MAGGKHEFDFEAQAIQSHLPCDDCGSSDALALYPTHTRCYACNRVHPVNTDDVVRLQAVGATRMKSMAEDKLLDGSYNSGGLKSRRLDEETLRKFSYLSGTYHGKPVQIAQYRDKANTIIAQKLRLKDKTFPWLGKSKAPRLFGSHLWSGGKKIVITEGEIDAMSVSQIQNHKWPVVSIPNGAAGAVRDLKNNLDYLQKFDEVILMFDMDEDGEEATKKAAEALGPFMTVKIAQLPLKDANECLVKGRGEAVVQAIWNATEYRPDGIKSAKELFEEWRKVPEASSVTYPFTGLTKVTKGLRKGELVMMTAGSGIGKSTLARETAFHLHQMGEKVGMIMLEEGTRKTLDNLVGMAMNRRLELLRQSTEEEERSSVNQEEIEKVFMDLFSDERMFLDEHWGSEDFDRLLTKMRYLAVTKDVDWIILDHISIAISGLDIDDERKALDIAMTKFRQLAEAANIGIILITHLRKPPSGDSWEEGRIPTLEDLRGSGGIGQLSDIVIGCFRNKKDPEKRLWTGVYVIKNRFTGEDGQIACWLQYDMETGRLTEGDPDFARVVDDDGFDPADDGESDF